MADDKQTLTLGRHINRRRRHLHLNLCDIDLGNGPAWASQVERDEAIPTDEQLYLIAGVLYAHSAREKAAAYEEMLRLKKSADPGHARRARIAAMVAPNMVQEITLSGGCVYLLAMGNGITVTAEDLRDMAACLDLQNSMELTTRDRAEAPPLGKVTESPPAPKAAKKTLESFPDEWKEGQ